MGDVSTTTMVPTFEPPTPWTCPYTEDDFINLEFSAPTEQFENTKALIFLNRLYPSGNNITAVIAGDEDGWEYIKGLLIASIILMCIVIGWSLCIVTTKCCGHRKVGGWSGKIQIEPKPSEESYQDRDSMYNHTYQQELHKWQEHYNRQKRRHRFAVITIVFSGICIVVSAILMSVKGVQSLVNSLHSGIAALEIVDGLAQGGIEIIDDALQSQNASQQAVLQLLDATNRICGGDRDLCTNISDIDTCDFTGIEEVVDRVGFTQLLDVLDSYTDELYDDLEQGRNDLVYLQTVANDMMDKAKTFNWAYQIARVFSILLAVLCLIIMHGVMFSKWTKFFLYLRRGILIPLFVFLVFLCFVFSLVFVIGSQSIADLCYDSPDDNMLLVVEKLESNFSELVYSFIVFYIKQCPVNSAPIQLQELIFYLVTLLNYLRSASSRIVNVGTGRVEQLCTAADQVTETVPVGFEVTPGDGVPPVEAAFDATGTLMCRLIGFLVQIRLYLDCDNWHPLYTTTMWDAVCYNGTDGFLWVSATTLCITFFAMVMLTARAGFYELEMLDDETSVNGDNDQQEKCEDEGDTVNRGTGEEEDNDGSQGVRDENGDNDQQLEAPQEQHREDQDGDIVRYAGDSFEKNFNHTLDEVEL